MSPRTPPGETREKVLRFVRQRLLEGQPPTIREVQEAFGFRSVQTAREHLSRLVDEGRLVHQRGRSRGYALPAAEGTAPARLIPLLGHVQAGALSVAIEEHMGTIPVTARGGDELFALRVEGESMTGIGILPGDIAVVRVQSTAGSGDVVVALVGDEATVKRLRIRRGRIELHPENPDFDPIVPPRGAVTILGKVVEIRRSLAGSP